MLPTTQRVLGVVSRTRAFGTCSGNWRVVPVRIVDVAMVIVGSVDNGLAEKLLIDTEIARREAAEQDLVNGCRVAHR